MTLVRLATDADLTRICRTALHAFADDPVMRWLYPDDTDYHAGDGAILRFMFRRWMANESVFTTDDCVAVAAFVPPGRPEVEIEPEPNPPAFPAGLLERFATIGAIIGEHTPPEPHWYLNMLGTHPHWQRQGLGTMVMGPITEVCDREGLALYLETETVTNVAYYSHLGFMVRSEWDVPLDGPHMWGMIRQPQR
jgi:GNAT superfamily N-acetyltransferase